MQHAVIIGAGIIGNAIAREMARAGWPVTVVDKAPEAGHGSTSASSAVIRINYSVLETCAMALEAWHVWRDWGGYLGDLGDRPLARYRETGTLVIPETGGPGLGRITAIMDQIGGAWVPVAAADLGRFLPGADPQAFAPPRKPDDEGFAEPSGPAVAGAVFFPQAGYVSDPKLAAQNLQWAAEREGARFRFGRRVTGIETQGGRVSGVRLDNGETLAATVVVNAGGPWSAGLNALAGVVEDMAIKTRPNVQEVAYIPGPAGMDYARDGIVVADLDTGVYLRPDPVGICIGSTDPACDPQVWLDDPDRLDPSFTDQWMTIVMRAAQRLPAMGIPGQASGLVALYDTSDDWLPIYDRTSLAGFYVACGTSGNQFKMAPVVGRLMARLIAVVEAGHDHDADPVRFHLDRVGRDIDLSIYSRNRPLNADSSRSVMG